MQIQAKAIESLLIKDYNRDRITGYNKTRIQDTRQPNSQPYQRGEHGGYDATTSTQVARSGAVTCDEPVAGPSRLSQLQQLFPAKGTATPSQTPSEPKTEMDKPTELPYEGSLPFVVRQKAAQTFLNPIDPVELEHSDYFDFIKHPMDLTTIRQRLRNQFYQSASECVSDFQRIVCNVHVYNGHESQAFDDAELLENIFMESLVKMPQPEVEWTRRRRRAQKASDSDASTDSDDEALSFAELRRLKQVQFLSRQRFDEKNIIFSWKILQRSCSRLVCTEDDGMVEEVYACVDRQIKLAEKQKEWLAIDTMKKFARKLRKEKDHHDSDFD
ncbi:Bromodomain-containing protein 3 [Orchesella cincta]|uniref:Bromodomain-containing protein 3 n=1 Tax=Orchesella cincta TaxID=48709 RepID=A0A1D2MEK1_ORCCI|nr:Bromodomain-containing protein 3 [Orchesella cincta]